MSKTNKTYSKRGVYMKNFRITWKIRLVNEYGYFCKEIPHTKDITAENAIEAIKQCFGFDSESVRKLISDISIMEC